MSLAMFVTYVLTGNTLTSEKVFTVVGIFVSARVVLTIFVPSSIMFLKEGGVSMKRIQVRVRITMTLVNKYVNIQCQARRVPSAQGARSTCSFL